MAHISPVHKAPEQHSLFFTVQFPGAWLSLQHNAALITEQIRYLWCVNWDDPFVNMPEFVFIELNKVNSIASPENPRECWNFKTLCSVCHTFGKNFKGHLLQSPNYKLRTKNKVTLSFGAAWVSSSVTWEGWTSQSLRFSLIPTSHKSTGISKVSKQSKTPWCVVKHTG